MTAQQVIDFFAPQESSIEIVRNWLQKEGISKDRISLSTNKQVSRRIGMAHLGSTTANT